MNKFMGVIAAGALLSGCEGDPPDTAARALSGSTLPASATSASRWYSAEQVKFGARLYAQHCAQCHQPNAEGSADWKTRDADGRLPPPPLNGTAHAWHHSLDILRQVIRRGGVPVGGSMPAFGNQLLNDEIDAILAWVQSHWSDEVYALWRERDLAVSQIPAVQR